MKGIFYPFEIQAGGGEDIIKSDTPPSDTSKFWFNTKDYKFYFYDNATAKWYPLGQRPPLPVTLDILGDGSCDSLFQFENNLDDDGGVLTATGNDKVIYTDGVNGRGVLFDTNQNPKSFIKIEKDAPLYLTFWVCLKASNGNNKYILDNRGAGLNGKSYIYYRNYLGKGGINKLVTLHDDNKTDVPINTWVFFYVEITKDCAGFGLGNYTRRPSSRYSMNGIIDQVRVFNRALTDDEINEVFEAEKSKFLGE